jgi:hypothetical protein
MVYHHVPFFEYCHFGGVSIFWALLLVVEPHGESNMCSQLSATHNAAVVRHGNSILSRPAGSETWQGNKPHVKINFPLNSTFIIYNLVGG